MIEFGVRYVEVEQLHLALYTSTSKNGAAGRGSRVCPRSHVAPVRASFVPVFALLLLGSSPPQRVSTMNTFHSIFHTSPHMVTVMTY